MTMNIDELFRSQTGPQWLNNLLVNGTTLGLKTTAWQSGGMTRTVVAIMANSFASEDGQIAIIAQGGFLDWAANGYVEYTSTNGEALRARVTPDPSVPGENPDGVPGWLDVLAYNGYDVERIGAQQASGVENIVNSSATTYGPFTPGTYHITNPVSGFGYSNATSVTIAPSVVAGTSITAATNAAPIAITTSAPHGLTGSEIVHIGGALGNVAANGFWSVVVTGASSFTLVDSSGTGAYTSGGVARIALGHTFQADLAGPTATAAPGAITQPVTVLAGVEVTNVLAFVGAEWESNQALVVRCRLKLQSLSPMGPRGAYEFFALSSDAILAAQDPPVFLTTPITRVVVQASTTTGVVNTVVASATGAVGGITNRDIASVSNTTPIGVTMGVAHTLNTGDYVVISGVIGTTNANGTWKIAVTGATTFTLDGTFGNALYVGGGQVDGGDLGMVNTVVQAYARPDGITATTSSAIGFSVAVLATVHVPQNNVAIYLAAAQVALTTYFALLPIGGISNVLQYENVIGVLYAAGITGSGQSYVKQIPVLTLDGVSADLAYPSPLAVAQLVPSPVINVVGV